MRNIYILIVLTIFISAAISCKKEGVTKENITTSTVMLFNAFPVTTTPAITTDVYFNGKKITMSALGYATQSTSFVVNAGVKDVAFKRSSDSSVLAQTSNIELKQGAVNTLYLTGTTGDGSIVSTSDDFSPAPEGKAKIRAIHLGPNLPAADFYMVGGATVTKALPFKSHTEYMVVDTGSFVFQVRDASTYVVRGSTASIKLASKQCYTFIARGLVSGSPALTIQILNNIKPY
jgi:hypothetical protein